MSIPCVRMNRVTFARSTYSGVGDQTMSLTGSRYGARCVPGASTCPAGCGGPRPFDIHGAMGLRVGVAGVGWSGFAPTTQGVSYKELMFEAARQRVRGRGRRPAQRDRLLRVLLGGHRGGHEHLRRVRARPARRRAAARPDGRRRRAVRGGHGGDADPQRRGATVAVESHSKASDVVSLGRVERFAMDPVLNRPARRVTRRCSPASRCADGSTSRAGREAECADVATRNRAHAGSNPRASYADVRDPTPVVRPAHPRAGRASRPTAASCSC